MGHYHPKVCQYGGTKTYRCPYRKRTKYRGSRNSHSCEKTDEGCELFTDPAEEDYQWKLKHEAMLEEQAKKRRAAAIQSSLLDDMTDLLI